MEFHHIIPHDADMDGEDEEKFEDSPAAPDPPIWSEVLILLLHVFLLTTCFTDSLFQFACCKCLCFGRCTSNDTFSNLISLLSIINGHCNHD